MKKSKNVSVTDRQTYILTDKVMHKGAAHEINYIPGKSLPPEALK